MNQEPDVLMHLDNKLQIDAQPHCVRILKMASLGWNGKAAAHLPPQCKREEILLLSVIPLMPLESKVSMKASSVPP
eukprot:1161658-Pelagomonas_calceolata.AAC.6